MSKTFLIILCLVAGQWGFSDNCHQVSGNWNFIEDTKYRKLSAREEIVQNGCSSVYIVNKQFDDGTIHVYDRYLNTDGTFRNWARYAKNDNQWIVRNKRAYLTDSALVEEEEVVRESDKKRLELFQTFTEVKGDVMKRIEIWYSDLLSDPDHRIINSMFFLREN